jgi:hypothetical protein
MLTSMDKLSFGVQGLVYIYGITPAKASMATQHVQPTSLKSFGGMIAMDSMSVKSHFSVHPSLQDESYGSTSC